MISTTLLELHSQPITSVGYPETKQISRRPRVRCATWCWKIPPEVFRSEYIRNRTKPVFRKDGANSETDSPKLATDIDTGLPVFLLDGMECIIKGDQVFQDGRRILLFSTDEHLRILARAREILGDGTFRITPHLWCQTFVISASVSGSSFVPVPYCLLPDKKNPISPSSQC